MTNFRDKAMTLAVQAEQENRRSVAEAFYYIASTMDHDGTSVDFDEYRSGRYADHVAHGVSLAITRESTPKGGAMTDPYHSFLASKRIEYKPVGFEPISLNHHAKPFQQVAIRRACVMGRSAMWEDCGLGKSIQELDWACQVYFKTGKPVLILTPLGVTKQYEREAAKFGIAGVKVCRTKADIGSTMIVVANYERLHHFDASVFGGIVLDEAACIKSYEGVFRKEVTAFAKPIPFRLSATATPAPNDLIELTNQAEFLDVMTGKEIIATFFTQKGNSASEYRLKAHAHDAFWHWLATWTTALRKPSDLGFDDTGYDLPELVVHEHIAEAPTLPGYLIPMEAQSLTERRQARKASLPDRVRQAAALAMAEPDEPWLIWCGLNHEAEELVKLIPGSMECRGTDTAEEKEAKFAAFADGSLRVLITKSTIAGWGLNFQHCARTTFVGLSDSFEQLYQSIRRFWRFGQTRPVHVHLIASEAEGAVLANLQRKEKQAAEMYEKLTAHMKEVIEQTSRNVAPYDPTVAMKIPHWLTSENAA